MRSAPIAQSRCTSNDSRLWRRGRDSEHIVGLTQARRKRRNSCAFTLNKINKGKFNWWRLVLKVFAHTRHSSQPLLFLLSPSLSLSFLLSFLVSSHLVSYFHPFKGPCGTRGRKTGRLLARARMRKQEQSSYTLWLCFLATTCGSTVWQHRQFCQCEPPLIGKRRRQSVCKGGATVCTDLTADYNRLQQSDLLWASLLFGMRKTRVVHLI